MSRYPEETLPTGNGPRMGQPRSCRSGPARTGAKSSANRRVRVLSNIPAFLSENALQIENVYIEPHQTRVMTLIVLFKHAIQAHRYDVIFLNCATFETLAMGLLAYVFPCAWNKVITADLILRRPDTFWKRLLALIKRAALRPVRSFISRSTPWTSFENNPRQRGTIFFQEVSH